MFLKKELILLSLLPVEAELPVGKFFPGLWEVLDSFVIGMWLMPLWELL
jgi:hypothetical protein